MSKQEENRRYRAKIRGVVNQARTVPCSDCGNTYPCYVMEFDHLGDKIATVGALAGSKSVKVVLAEIAKCDVVCANCHKIRTFNRRESGSSSKEELPFWERKVGMSGFPSPTILNVAS
jgi:hypothetical protein